MTNNKAFDPTVFQKPLVLFDGVCNLCNGSVQFIIRNDENGRFLFTSLQSPTGQAVLAHFGIENRAFSSVLLLMDGELFEASTAVFKITQQLSTKWAWVSLLIKLPKPIRDLGYQIIAKNRYRLFGKQEQCWLPTPELKSRFL